MYAINSIITHFIKLHRNISNLYKEVLRRRITSLETLITLYYFSRDNNRQGSTGHWILHMESH